MEDAIALAVNAGLDMSMIPLDAGSADNGFVPNLIKAVNGGKVSQARIDDAVSHVLALKFRLGLFEHPYVDASRANAAVEDPATVRWRARRRRRASCCFATTAYCRSRATRTASS